MTKIHMETEDVRETAHLLDLTCGELYYMPGKLRGLASSIATAWQGGAASRYSGELRRHAEILQREVISLQRLAERVSNEVNQWENADNNGADAWLRIRVTPGTPGVPGEEQETTKEKFSWWNWGGAVGGGILTVGTGVVGGMQKLTYVDYQGMGSYLNKLAGNQKAGWVGKMDDLGHLVKKNSFFTSPGFKYSADAFSVAFGVADDLKSGDSWLKAIGSEGLELGITKGITKGLTYLIPGAGQVMLAYEGVLLAGRLVAGAADILGYDEQAAQLQNAIDVVDLSTYTEKLTDGIFDIVENRRR